LQEKEENEASQKALSEDECNDKKQNSIIGSDDQTKEKIQNNK
jgi:hypothetical protein